ncbi:MAG: sigma-54-dependent Fis family transcriptional regulator, partial [Myxococcales bacterium]|nr:sigma-54-dependent Fis family transcriptional regulator [Myxococcales bacterium]
MNATSGRVVVVDDDESSCQGLVEVLREEGHEVEGATSPERALELIAATDPDVVITDLEMPAMSGVDLIRRAKVRTHHATFVVLTAFGSYEAAVAAIKEGADQFLTKPLDVEVVIAIVARAVVRARLSREAAGLRDRPQSGGPRTILGSHPAMQALLDKIQQVAESQATVLIIGETGTGKELVATAIHYASQRKAGPFVKLNCAALAETLLESELFGHERGAFTGATTQRNGRFEQADGGTLFLDEVSEIPMPLQVKLLRFLQEREFERVGGNETIQVDTRVVAATNRPLRRLVEEGSFREDLFYRLNVVGLEIPPL